MGLKQRADKELVDRGLVATRAQAKSLIEMGKVRAGNRTLAKAGELVGAGEALSVEAPVYVGRGAFKLEAALSGFGISPLGQSVVDVGASTGGFTEVLLAAGAVQVWAVDVGHGQLAEKLRSDPRVVNLEGTHILEWGGVLDGLDGAVMDLSFISVTKVLPHLRTLLRPGAWAIVLVKPQFEAGSARLPKDGVLKDPVVQSEVLREVLESATKAGWSVEGQMESPIEGKDGNREFLVLLRN